MPMDPAMKEEALARIREAARTAFGRGLQAILVHGSALREDFIPGYSDLDVHIYVAPVFLRDARTPELDPAVEFQKALGDVDPQEYGVSSFQVFFLNAKHPSGDWQKPLPGTYELVHGGPVDDQEPRAARLRKAHSHLNGYPDHVSALIARYADKPDAAVPGMTRLAGVFLKGAVLSAAVVASGRPGVVAERDLDGLLALLREKGVDTEPAERFFAAVRAWSTLRQDPDGCREAFRRAIEAMDGLAEWHRKRFPEREPASQRLRKDPRMGR